MEEGKRIGCGLAVGDDDDGDLAGKGDDGIDEAFLLSVGRCGGDTEGGTERERVRRGRLGKRWVRRSRHFL